MNARTLARLPERLEGLPPPGEALARVRAGTAELARLPRGLDPLPHARASAEAALAAYWAVRCPGGEMRRPPFELPRPDRPAEALASRIGRDAAVLPAGIAAYLLGSVYASLLPAEIRSRDGVFFTPPPLVERLLDRVEAAGFAWADGRVLDPAAGGGAFLAPVALRMARAMELRGASSADVVRTVSHRLAGLELDPFSAWMSQVLLEAALWHHCAAAGRRLPVLTMTADALLTPDGWEGGFDLVVGNPPYGRLTLPPELRARYARSLWGHANLYGLFTDLALRLVRPGGLVAYVTPTSFLSGKYFRNLRSLLETEAPPLSLDFVEDRSGVFDDVLQETMLAVYRRAEGARTLRIGAIRPAGLDAPSDAAGEVEVPVPAAGGEPWVLPRGSGDAALMQVVRRNPLRLRDYGFAVSTGPLVWNRHKPQLRDAPGAARLPLVWAESVSRNGFEFRALRNHVPFFQLGEAQEHLVARAPCVLVQRTTAKEHDRRLIAAVLPESFLAEHGGAVVENHLNMVRPVEGAPRIDLDTLAVLLNSRLLDQVFRCTSGSVAVSAFELESLPLPGPDAVSRLERRVRSGAPEEEIEAEVARAYEVG